MTSATGTESPPPVCSFTSVSKRYRTGHEKTSLRLLVPGPRGEAINAASFEALEDVSFEVRQGEAVGIIGDNGAGKSTVLKLLAGVIEPSGGLVRVEGRIAPLIELGVGFNPELTGAENLYFGGALLGLSAQEIRSRYDDIVAFSGIEDFLDMPVKRYSTGMVARLGFALASSIEADLLLVDEVLSVGDVAFQRKSLERIRAIHGTGTALVLVSHNLWMMGQLCDRLILLDRGRVRADGEPAEVIREYLPADYFPEPEPTEATTLLVDYELPDGPPACELIDLVCDPEVVEPGGSVTLTTELLVHQATTGFLALSVFTAERAVFTDHEFGPSSFLREPGHWKVSIRLPRFPLSTGRFVFRLAVLPTDDPDPDQTFRTALAQAEVVLHVRGPISSRPGLILDAEWSTELTGSGQVQSTPTRHG